MLLYDTETVNLETTGPSNKTTEHHILTKRRKNGVFQYFPSFLDKDIWPANSPDLNSLDDCIWDEFARATNWNKVTWKSSLIAELKRGVKKIRLYVVRESCSVWTNRLYHMTQNDRNYLRK